MYVCMYVCMYVVPLTYLDRWLALSTNFSQDLTLRHLLPDYLAIGSRNTSKFCTSELCR